MSLKGAIQPGHFPVNIWTLSILGLPDITFTKMSGFENELGVVDLPDRTRASGGQLSATEVEVTVPAHHTAQVQFMELWYREGLDPVSILYKKVGTLTMVSGDRTRSYAWAIVGAWISGRKHSDLEMANVGDMAELTYKMQIDSVTPISLPL